MTVYQQQKKKEVIETEAANTYFLITEKVIPFTEIHVSMVSNRREVSKIVLLVIVKIIRMTTYMIYHNIFQYK